MKVKIVLPLRTNERRGVAEREYELPDVPFPIPVTVYLGKSKLVANTKDLAWDERQGLTLRLEERSLGGPYEAMPPADLQLREDLRNPESGWTVRGIAPS
jgi:hypothetical protein